MAQEITLLGASYSAVPAVNLPKTGGGTATFTDVTDTTATASDVSSSKYFYTSQGVRTQGTNSGGSGDGYVWQDAQGYVHLSDEEGTQPIYDTLNVNASGTFTPSQGHAYNSVVVPSGSVTAPSTISGSSATVSTGTNTLTLSKTVSVTPSVTTAGYVTSGTAGNASVSLTASVNTRSSSDLTASNLTVTAPSGYYASNATKTLSDANLVAGNVKKNVTIFGVTGSYEGSGGSSGLEYETGTWTPSADTADYTISFTGTHTNAPFFYVINDSEGDYYTVANSNMQVQFVSNSLLGIDLYLSQTNIQYATVSSLYRGTSTTNFSSNGSTVSTNSTATLSDYATSTGIRAYTGSTSRYWRAGRAYKWIAVWAPTT